MQPLPTFKKTDQDMSLYEENGSLAKSQLWVEALETDRLGCSQYTPTLPFISYETLANQLISLSLSFLIVKWR